MSALGQTDPSAGAPATASSTITDPTGGVPNFNIYDVFESFGYTPTQAEINALAPAFEGRTNIGETGLSAVSNYVIAHQQVAGAQSQIQGQLTGAEASLAQAQALGVTGQQTLQSAADLYKQAPQLFGGLSPDQVSQYLAPLQTQFNQSLGQVQGAAASRGLSGSSVEATAMSQAQMQYQQQVLQQALQLGLQQQQNQAGALTNLGNSQIGLSGQNTGTYSSLINSLLGQNSNASAVLGGLGSQSANAAISQQAAIQALNPSAGSGLGADLGLGLGAVGGVVGGIYGGPLGASAGFSAGDALGQGIGGAINPNQNPSSANQLGQNSVNSGLLAYLLGKQGGGGSSGGGTGTSGLLTSTADNTSGLVSA